MESLLRCKLFSAQDATLALMIHLGYDNLTRNAAKLNPASKSIVQAHIDKVRPNLPAKPAPTAVPATGKHLFHLPKRLIQKRAMMVEELHLEKLCVLPSQQRLKPHISSPSTGLFHQFTHYFHYLLD